MLTRNEAILVKLESTYGTDPVPTGSNAIALAAPVQANPTEQARFTERPVIRGGSIGKAAPIFGGTLFGLTIEVEVKGSGDAEDTPPEWGVLLKACGFQETINAATSVVYAPRSTGHESCTIWYYQDGLRYRVTGCRGNVSFRGTVGEVMIATFTMVGRMTSGDPTDTAQLTPTLDAGVPPVFMATNFFSLDAYNPVFNEWTIDMQNGVSPGVNANAADGYGEIRITERDPRGTIDPEMTLVATQDWIGDLFAGNTQNMSFQLGTVGGARFQFDIGVARYMEQSFDDRDGNRVVPINYKADETVSLNDEVTLTFD